MPDWLVVPATGSSEVRRFVEAHHYLRSVGSRAEHVFAVYSLGEFFGPDALLGAAMFARPGREFVARSLWAEGDFGNTVELARFYTVDDPPRNLGSWLLSRSVHMLPPELEMVVAFSDPFAHHHGGLYQAASWLYTGTDDADNYHYVDAEGRRVAKQTPWRIAQRQRQSGLFVGERPVDGERRVCAERGWVKVRDLAKHRYVKPRTKRARHALCKPCLPYPKPDTA